MREKRFGRPRLKPGPSYRLPPCRIGPCEHGCSGQRNLILENLFQKIRANHWSGGTDQNLVPDLNVRTGIDDFNGAVYESGIVQMIEPMLIIPCIIIANFLLGSTVRLIQFSLDRESHSDFFGDGDTVFIMWCADLLIAVEAFVWQTCRTYSIILRMD